ncbi:MAG TPA: outer membrane protein assembly factor BamA [Opitutaceae bacterium]|nr:outer membrane protein assembly factor BamA [Opitutaceae bacterium]
MKTTPNSWGPGSLRLAAAALALCVGAAAAWAQAEAPATEAGPPKKVGTLAIKFIGVANVSEQIVRANIQVREGAEFDDPMIDKDIRTLYRTGLFEFIEVKREELPNNVVNLVFEITPKYRVQAVRFEGNKRIKSNRLEKEISIRPNTALDERAIKADSEKLHEYYQKSGYNQAQITYNVERDRTTGFGTVTFKIREGAKVRIADVRFTGNDHVKPKRLRKEMDTKRWWMFSWLTGSGKFKDDQFEDDIGKLLDFYREQGYLDVDIPQDRIAYEYPKPDRMVIVIHVDEGRQYRIGEITITGCKLYTESLLKLVLRQKSGMIFRPSKLDKDVETMEDFYGRSGYLDTRVRLVRKPNVATGNIDVEYQVDESDKFYVESVKIEGNTKTKSTVIIRELVLSPGDVFDMVRMKASKLRLENTNFFEDVNLTPESTNIPGRRNLKISLKEARTGNVSFGAGYSSLERATFFAELSQSNFDLFNRHSFFQGAGQKFRIRLQVGSLSNEAILSFEEPWLFQKELALGFSIYRQSSSYTSSYYDEIRMGAEIYVRKHLFEYVEGRLSYTDEKIDITNVDPSVSAIILALAGYSRTSKIGLQLLRDVRDKIVNTTRGNRLQVITEFAGGPLGGSNDYYEMEVRGSQFIPVFRAQTQVLGLIARTGVIENFGKSEDVPFYDKFFLGGPDDLRGFEYRDVGPKDPSGIPLGGKTYGMFTAEYSLDVVKPIRFAIFYDAGFVNAKAYDFTPSTYNDDFGVGLRMFVAGAPLSLDFGIPLTGDKVNKKGNQFNFSFGTRF